MVRKKSGICFLAACYQLSGDKNRGKYANAMIGDKAVRVICGYHEQAPGAGPNRQFPRQALNLLIYFLAASRHLVLQRKSGGL